MITYCRDKISQYQQHLTSAAQITEDDSQNIDDIIVVK